MVVEDMVALVRWGVVERLWEGVYRVSNRTAQEERALLFACYRGFKGQWQIEPG